MPHTITDLPSVLFVPALKPAPGAAPEAIKATNPEGKTLPIAFTSADELQRFAVVTRLDLTRLRLLEVKAEELLEQLVAAGEPEVCIDPMTERETLLSYNRAGAVRRAQLPHGAMLEVRPASFALPAEYLDLLRTVASQLPTVEAVWLMELEIKKEGAAASDDKEIRPLLVLRQNVPESDPAFHDAFMELGDRWCESLPRGVAVDMLPDFAQPLAGALPDACQVYRSARR